MPGDIKCLRLIIIFILLPCCLQLIVSCSSDDNPAEQKEYIVTFKSTVTDKLYGEPINNARIEITRRHKPAGMFSSWPEYSIEKIAYTDINGFSSFDIYYRTYDTYTIGVTRTGYYDIKGSSISLDSNYNNNIGLFPKGNICLHLVNQPDTSKFIEISTSPVFDRRPMEGYGLYFFINKPFLDTTLFSSSIGGMMANLRITKSYDLNRSINKVVLDTLFLIQRFDTLMIDNIIIR